MSKRPEYIHERMGGKIKPGDIHPYVLVPGSEKRVERFASLWDTSHKIAHHYEYLVYSGKYAGIPVSACSTGCGGRATSIAVDEMAALGANTFLRVGVTGAIQDDIQVGDLIIATGAVRMDQTSEHYVFVEYPAIANHEIVCALIAAAERRGYQYHVGIVATAATFYAGEGVACYGNYKHSGMMHIEEDLKAAKVLDWDNETATIFTLCSLYGLRAGRINAVVDDPKTGQYNPIGEERAIQASLDALRILFYWDSKKVQARKKYIYPGFEENYDGE